MLGLGLSPSSSSTPGWRSLNAGTALATSVAPAVGKLTIRSRPPRRILACPRELALGLLEAGDHGIWRGRPARGPRIGEPDAAVIALRSLVPVSSRERRDLLADGGWGEVQRVGGSGEGAVVGHLAKDPHSPNVQHKRV